MIRVEIIANHSVEENILEAFQAEGVAKYYTKFPTVFGVGASGPRMGDAIWPEENFALVVWCERAEAEGIERAVASVKEHFTDEGIMVFKLEASTGSAPPSPLPLTDLSRPLLSPLSLSKSPPTGPEGENS
jgi:hypothetical protein